MFKSLAVAGLVSVSEAYRTGYKAPAYTAPAAYVAPAYKATAAYVAPV